MKGIVRTIRPLLTPRILFATGTVVSESPNNAYPILKVLSPEKVDVGRARWDRHFVIRAKTRAGPVTRQKAIAYSNLEELKRMLEHCSVRRLKKDIRGMPDRTEGIRHCNVTANQAEAYNECMRGVLAELDEKPEWIRTLDFAMVRILRLRQLLSHPKILGLSGDSGKHIELDNIVEEVLSEPSSKLLIWCEWLAGVDALAERYRNHGVLTVDGRTSQGQLAEWERTFDYSPERIVCATPARGGTGLDWLSRCRTAVYLEKPYSTVLFRQSQDRIVRRVGDDLPEDTPDVERIKAIKRSTATIIYLHVPGSVDDVVSWVLQRKLDLGDALLTADDRLLSDGREDLIRLLRQSARI